MNNDALQHQNQEQKKVKEGSESPNNPIRHVIAVMSGKGGVGKSLVTGLLGSALARYGYKVGILDADITGPSIPTLFGLHGPVQADGEKIVPLESRTGIKVMSMNLLIDKEDQPIIWRGPLISQAIKQLYGDVLWGTLDYLLVDLPPGTSDATLTIMQSLPLKGTIMVSTPQSLAALVVTKAIHMSQKLNVPILGIVENMAYFLCPSTGVKHYVFGPSHANDLASVASAPLLTRFPIDPEVTALCDKGRVEDVVSLEADELMHALLYACSDDLLRGGEEVISSAPIIETPFESEHEADNQAHVKEEVTQLNEFSEQAKVLIMTKENWGMLDAPDIRARIRGCCGDSMQLDLRIEEGIIQDARFLTDGCGASIAAASMVTKMALGKCLDEAMLITQHDVLEQLDGLPSDHQHCAKLAVMTLEHTIKAYLSKKAEVL